jgi:hypothetical protein
MVESGEAQLVIGTHALIQDTVQFAKLGLVIVDEQHRFGVGQRLTLRNKGSNGLVPHQLMMSATPIPRTLAMTYYADLEVSVIDELPPGPQPDRHARHRPEPARRSDRARARGRAGRPPGVLGLPADRGIRSAAAADRHRHHEMLAEALPDLQVGLVHGRMKPAEKQEVMDAFSAGEVHVLVATTVIEVGVDVPNASLMVIEHAERFGLSQLHQLRGRVGRGSAASVCLLLYQSPLGPGGQAAPDDDARDHRRLRDRAPRPRDPRPRRIPRRAPVGPGDAALRRPGDRPVAGRAGARRGGRAAGSRRAGRRHIAIVDAHLARWLGKTVLAHGFVPKYSIISNATIHRDRRFVFNLDLENFFGEINFGRVRGYFIKNRDFELHPSVATVLAQIGCHNNVLPQGSPCSPVLSNLIAHLLDIRLAEIAYRHGCMYSRYADDLTFSTNKKNFPIGIAKPVLAVEHAWEVGKAVAKVISKLGFHINAKKTRMQYCQSRQIVTGLVVNRKVSVPYEYKRTNRAMSHRLFQTGAFYFCRIAAVGETTEEIGSLNKLQGRLNFNDHVEHSNRERIDSPVTFADTHEKIRVFLATKSYTKIFCFSKIFMQ